MQLSFKSEPEPWYFMGWELENTVRLCPIDFWSCWEHAWCFATKMQRSMFVASAFASLTEVSESGPIYAMFPQASDLCRFTVWLMSAARRSWWDWKDWNVRRQQCKKWRSASKSPWNVSAQIFVWQSGRAKSSERPELVMLALKGRFVRICNILC